MRDIMLPTADIDNAKILMDYDILLRGPRNNSRAFIKVMVQQGASYAANCVSQAESADANGLRISLTRFRLADAFATPA
jgi:hypothetical protein